VGARSNVSTAWWLRRRLSLDLLGDDTYASHMMALTGVMDNGSLLHSRMAMTWPRGRYKTLKVLMWIISVWYKVCFVVEVLAKPSRCSYRPRQDDAFGHCFRS
jgi:hypothetical protein